MRIMLRRVVGLAGVLAAAALAPAARAQGTGWPPPNRIFTTVPTFTAIGVRTTVTVPDGGTASVGGYGRLSEGRVGYGPPVLGRLPYAGRGVGNVAYGRSAAAGRVAVSVRVIDLREEEYRQTGYRSR
jgi:Flp pilus assembly secretin CpaC